MSDIVDTVLDDLVKLLKKDQIKLPSLPEVAMQVKEIAENKTSTVFQLNEAISGDPALSARLIQIVNSPLFRAAQDVKDLPMAISRLGITYSSNLAIGLAMEQMFKANNKMVEMRMRELWLLITQVSSWASVLAIHTKSIPPDEAMLAGLVHRIGALPVLTYAEMKSELIDHNGVLGRVIDRIHGPLGTAILERWDFTENLTQVPKLYRKIDRKIEKPDYAGIITLANLVNARHKNMGWGNVDWQTVPMFKTFGLPDDKEDILWEELADKVNEQSSWRM
ncbi:HDOD domain-containing protein [Reinekea thalattae]|uniref:HDOD domain-containing protein n=1 Tax=Reinekea thalattae TaxID=2593301 RepID=A0A5C8Z754_9GAMM|nr:HDOD domain-containing protein [Reinekea thalattae]TXR53068.1 HDOD domain-containing protein [Reinekea thalattae]